MQTTKKILFCDLDGTLIGSGEDFSRDNLEMLYALRAAGIVVALASGRSLHSLGKVISTEIPFDYAIFSTGVGIIDWQRQKNILQRELSECQAQRALQILLQEKVDFMVQAPLPDNHYFHYQQFSSEEKSGTDFCHRIRLYKEFCSPLARPAWRGGASQLLAVLHPGDPRFSDLCSKLQEFSVIRATSPLDGHSIWLEIFAPGVSKSSAAAWLSSRLPTPSTTYALGNDHNDIDLLDWAKHSLVAENSPPQLQARFNVVRTSPRSTLRQAAQIWGLL